MDSTLGAVIITALVGLIGSVLAVRQALAQTATQATVAENTNEIEQTKVLVEGWARFAESMRVDNERLKHDLEEERAVSAAFSAKVDRLTAELATLRNRSDGEEPDHPLA